MDEPGALLTVAEIAVGIAGFAGIAIVLARRSGEWAETDTIRPLVLLTASGNAFILALLSAGLILAGLRAGTLAAASSALMLVLSGISTIFLTPRILRYRRRAPAEVLSPFLYRFMLSGIIVFALAAQLVNCIGFPFGPRLSVFFFGLVWMLLMGFIQLARIVFVRPRS